MNTEEAKAILQSFRPGSEDESDPHFKEALRLLEEDESLNEWFAQEMAFDQAFSAKLQEIHPPADLKTKILGQETTEPEIEYSKGTAIPFSQEENSVSWWRNPMFISMAASIIVLLGFITLLIRPNTLQASEGDLPRFYDAVSYHADNFPGLATRSDNLDEIKTYLASHSVPTPGELPQGVRPMTPIGCVSYEWEGRSVAVICMGGQKVHHLYVVHRADFPNDIPPIQPAFKQKGDQALAAWADSKNIYVLIVRGNTQHLEEIL